MRPFDLLFLVAAVAPLCLADVEFTLPAAGGSYPAGTLAMGWKDSGNSPSISDLTSYQIDLMAGGDTDADSAVIVNLIPPGTKFTTDSAQGVVQAALSGEEANAYYLRITSVASTGGTMINFSPRFTITGMTGTFPAAALSGLPVKSTAARASINQVAQNNAAANPVGDGFNVPYNEQSGPTRYAPMMSPPPTSITKTNTAPLFPTSSVSFASTFLPTATIETTITQSNTYFVSQMENTASPVSNPNEDMQKFLNRWKD